MSTETKNKTNWVFFGSSRFSVIVLNELEKVGLVPQLIVTTPDKPKGRGLNITPNDVKKWAEEREISVFAPVSLKDPVSAESITDLGPWDVFLVASYGKIIPRGMLDIPKFHTLNIHPSLLPKFRGPTPLESAILQENETGVSIMKVDEEVDHGPVIAQKAVAMPEWPPYYLDLEKALAEEGARLFAEILPKWIAGTASEKEQDHAAATFTRKFSRSESKIVIGENSDQALRKIRAFSGNGDAFFMEKNGLDGASKERIVKVTRARVGHRAGNDEVIFERVKPEGKNEMGYDSYTRGRRV